MLSKMLLAFSKIAQSHLLSYDHSFYRLGTVWPSDPTPVSATVYGLWIRVIASIDKTVKLVFLSCLLQ